MKMTRVWRLVGNDWVQLAILAGLFQVMIRSMDGVPNKIFTTKLSTTTNETVMCRPSETAISFTMLSVPISLFEAELSRRSAAGCIYFLQDGWRNYRSIKFRPPAVSNFSTTTCNEQWLFLTLSQIL